MESKTTEWRTAFAENMRMYRVIHFEKNTHKPTRLPNKICTFAWALQSWIKNAASVLWHTVIFGIISLGDGSDPALRQQNGAVTGTGQPRPFSLQQTCIGRLAFSWSKASRAGELFLCRVLSHTLFSLEMRRATQTRHAFPQRKKATHSTDCSVHHELRVDVRASRNETWQKSSHRRHFPLQTALKHWSMSEQWITRSKYAPCQDGAAETRNVFLISPKNRFEKSQQRRLDSQLVP